MARRSNHNRIGGWTHRYVITGALTIFSLLVLPQRAEPWWQSISGQLSVNDGVAATAVDSAENTVAVGYIANDFAVVKFSGASGGEIWRQTFDRKTSSLDQAYDVAIDAAGDVVVGGQLAYDLVVIKLSGTTGDELWRMEIPSLTPSYENFARRVALNPAGDVIVAAALWIPELPGRRLVVLKLAAATGTELWRKQIDGNTKGPTEGYALTVGPDGDAYVAGHVRNGDAGADFFAARLDGSSGEELWRQSIDGDLAGPSYFSSYKSDVARSIVLGASGDVFVGGYLTQAYKDQDFAVLKFDGNTGDEMWRYLLDVPGFVGIQESDSAESLTIDQAGDVVAAGILHLAWSPSDTNFTVVKLAGATGAELWQQQLNGAGGPPRWNHALSVVVNSTGDVIAGGRLYGTTPYSAFVVRFSGASGLELWRQQIDERMVGWAPLLLDAAGDIIVAGRPYVSSWWDGDFAVVKLLGSSGGEIWRHEINGLETGYGGATAAAFDQAGNVVAAGYLDNATTGEDLVVTKLAATDGSEIWRQQIDGASSSDDRAYAVTTDATGDVIVGGKLSAAVGSWDFMVAKFAADTGTELWRYQIAGTEGGSATAESLAIDPAGDVIAAGTVKNLGTGFDAAVVKLAAAGGTELWRQELDGPGHENETVRSVEIDAAGDVYLAIEYNQRILDSAVVKLAGATGAVLWRYPLNHNDGRVCGARALALDSSGDVVVAGTIRNSGSDRDFLVVKLARAAGDEIWRREIDERKSYDVAESIDVDSAGNVIVGGTLGYYYSAVKLDGATGANLWRKKLGWQGSALSVVATPSGDFVTAGHGDQRYREGRGDVFTIAILSGNDGKLLRRQQIDYTYRQDFAATDAFLVSNSAGEIAVAMASLKGGAPFGVLKSSTSNGDFDLHSRWGQKITFKDYATNPQRTSLRFSLKDENIEVPAAGSVDDPRTAGATVTINNPLTGELGVVTLPPGSDWSMIGSPPNIRGYRYRDPTGTAGPCIKLVAKAGKALTVLCKGKTTAIPFTLDEFSQRNLLVSASLGSEPSQCANFFAPSKDDTSNLGTRGIGIFRSKYAKRTLVTCP